MCGACPRAHTPRSAERRTRYHLGPCDHSFTLCPSVRSYERSSCSSQLSPGSVYHGGAAALRRRPGRPRHEACALTCAVSADVLFVVSPASRNTTTLRPTRLHGVCSRAEAPASIHQLTMHLYERRAARARLPSGIRRSLVASDVVPPGVSPGRGMRQAWAGLRSGRARGMLEGTLIGASPSRPPRGSAVVARAPPV